MNNQQKNVMKTSVGFVRRRQHRELLLRLKSRLQMMLQMRTRSIKVLNSLILPCPHISLTVDVLEEDVEGSVIRFHDTYDKRCCLGSDENIMSS